MENPLSDEQIQELNEIIKLPREKQSSKLKEFFKTLNQEQINFLKQHQSQQCVFCGIALGQINSYKIYEDSDTVCVLDINPASKGHVMVIPRMHLKYSYEFSNKIFDVANLVVKKIKEVLGYDSNILIANGANAGEKFEHLVINVIPRYEEDGIDLNWKFNKANEEELITLSNQLKIEVIKKEEVKEFIERKPIKITRLP